MSPSLHAVPVAAFVVVQPTPVVHASTVQGLPSSQTSAVPGAHVPLALHVSAPLQGSPSLHAAPVDAFA
jgi:hypothetical protein